LITILGPTATGKTALAARLAYDLNGEVISADSRQVYRGMDIGTGKDYDDYVVNGTAVPYHLIDILEPGYEYNIYEYQKDFLKAYHGIMSRGKLPVLCGGSGMYLEAVLKGYMLARSEEDNEFLSALEHKTMDQLIEILKSFKAPHNITDLEERPRLLKAITVARAATTTSSAERFPEINSVNFGISFPRGLVKSRIFSRLESRLENGMIAEVQKLLDSGITPDRLMKYGLEYKFVTLYLTGSLSGSGMFDSLNIAIRQFAKRQMTWYRRMEKQGINIHWIDGRLPMEEKIEEIKEILNKILCQSL
jgi:tRNA dimethylallyltransferase